MHRAVRFQDSFHETLEADSLASAIQCTEKEDRARQEFAKDADINLLLKRFGLNLPVRHPEYGVVDFDLDLQGAYRAVAEARAGYDQLPAHLRERYPSWEAIVRAIEAGEEVSLTPPVEPAGSPPAEAADGGAGAAPPVPSGGAS